MSNNGSKIFVVLYWLLIVSFIMIFLQAKDTSDWGLTMMYPFFLAPLFVVLISFASLEVFKTNSQPVPGDKPIYFIDWILFYGSLIYIATVVTFDEYSYFIFRTSHYISES